MIPSYPIIPGNETWASMAEDGALTHFDEAAARSVAAEGKALYITGQLHHLTTEHSLALLVVTLIDMERAACAVKTH